MDDTMEAAEKGLKIFHPRKGGYRAAMFIFVMTGLENIGFIANMVSLVLYFLGVMHFGSADASTTLTNFIGATFLLTILGGFISDTYMTRLNTVLMFGLVEMVGYILVTIQAHYKNLHPDPTCLTCKPEGSSKTLFYLSFCLLALGYGGVRGALPALGADQFDRKDPKERKQLGSFFNWLLMSITLGATFGVTVIVWVSSEKSTWAVGFFSQMLIAIVGFGFLTVGKPFYRNRVAGDSPLLYVLQVIVVAIRNRKLSLPDSSEQLYEINDKEVVEEKIPHTDQFRFLDKAAVLAPDTSPEPWKVCTVTQVEEIKILTRMLPILASTILMNTCLAQLQTFSVQQGIFMDLSLGRFDIPPASIPVIPLVFMSVLVPVYEFAFVPLARRLTGHPTGITHCRR
ncbi:uncharacterized protein A4U43_C07F10500 [Asparagus officinalis]|uniref:Major facilitator superfamily (MFS) profile domain-containing protein n=1 Tax=Asparagus officinalis TaxID=4686 RepID=A0A5P1EAV5_ASPOF|nr:uncharacterized protein A4U43_C07F10500 [Asparagus officinalis]